MKYGYARVSSTDQNEDRQIIALIEAGVEPSNIFVDKISGSTFKRRAYRRMMRKVRPGDVIFVKSIDRFGRNYEEIIQEWRNITKKKKADIVVLDMPILDTRQEKNLIGTFLSDTVLQVLSFVAENERNNIRARQAEGIAAAKAKGKKFGRPAKPIPENFKEMAERVRNGEISRRKAAKLCGMPASTFMVHYKKYLKSLEHKSVPSCTKYNKK